jgi:hypothetical protein
VTENYNFTKLPHPPTKVSPQNVNFPSHTPTRDCHVTFKIPHLNGFITKSCGQQLDVMQTHGKDNIRNTENGRA